MVRKKRHMHVVHLESFDNAWAGLPGWVHTDTHNDLVLWLSLVELSEWLKLSSHLV